MNSKKYHITSRGTHIELVEQCSEWR